MKLKNGLLLNAMRLTSLFALFVAYSALPSYCITFLYEPEMPKALLDIAARD